MMPIYHYTRSGNPNLEVQPKEPEQPGRIIEIEKVIQDDWVAKRNKETIGTQEETPNGEKEVDKNLVICCDFS